MIFAMTVSCDLSGFVQHHFISIYFTSLQIDLFKYTDVYDHTLLIDFIFI